MKQILIFIFSTVFEFVNQLVCTSLLKELFSKATTQNHKKTSSHLTSKDVFGF
jgi:hypothetical protein